MDIVCIQFYISNLLSFLCTQYQYPHCEVQFHPHPTSLAG